MAATKPFSCTIEAKAAGGLFKKAPVREFFRNYTGCYSAVTAHVIKCPDCDPQAALLKWVELRKERNKGESSGGMLDCALKTERGAKRHGKTVSKDTVNWFITRIPSVHRVIALEERLTQAETIDWLQFLFNHWIGNDGTFSRADTISWALQRAKVQVTPRGRALFWMAMALATSFDEGGRDFPENLDKLAMVAEVMCS